MSVPDGSGGRADELVGGRDVGVGVDVDVGVGVGVGVDVVVGSGAASPHLPN
jgi:hypothetical protein